jgi:hypothetical protein
MHVFMCEYRHIDREQERYHQRDQWSRCLKVSVDYRVEEDLHVKETKLYPCLQI